MAGFCALRGAKGWAGTGRLTARGDSSHDVRGQSILAAWAAVHSLHQPTELGEYVGDVDLLLASNQVHPEHLAIATTTTTTEPSCLSVPAVARRQEEESRSDRTLVHAVAPVDDMEEREREGEEQRRRAGRVEPTCRVVTAPEVTVSELMESSSASKCSAGARERAREKPTMRDSNGGESAREARLTTTC